MSTINVASVDIKEELSKAGFCHFTGEQITISLDLLSDVLLLMEKTNELPLDTSDLQANRFRQFQTFMMCGWDGKLIPKPLVAYAQPGFVESGARQFAELDSTVRDSKLLSSLIRFDFDHLPIENKTSQVFAVNVHLIRFLPTLTQPANGNPSRLHKDGETVTFIHCVGRKSVRGGRSLITDNELNLKFKGCLTNFLDTLAVFDRAVYHYVEPVMLEHDCSFGFRDALLIDFTEFKPSLDEPALIDFHRLEARTAELMVDYDE